MKVIYFRFFFRQFIVLHFKGKFYEEHRLAIRIKLQLYSSINKYYRHKNKKKKKEDFIFSKGI